MQQHQQVSPADLNEEDEIDLLEYLEALLDAKWLIVLVTLVIGGLAGVYALLVTPIYQADALIQVESKSPSFGGSGANDFMNIMGQGDASASTEMEIIKSRSVMEKVIQSLHLDTMAEPKFFPKIGRYFYRTYDKEGFREPLLDMSSYAWGGEQIKLESLDVPSDLLGMGLRVVYQGKQHFELYDDDALLLKGVVGVLAENKDVGVRIFISQLNAREGVEFLVRKVRMLDALSMYAGGLGISEKGKGTGVISLTFTSDKPALAQSFLDTVAKVYLRQNVERKTEEAKRSLSFLKKQLPTVRNQLETAEMRMNEYRLKAGSVNLSLETQGVLTQVVDLDQQLSELDFKRTDLGQRFTVAHPLMIALGEKRARLLKDKQELEKKVQSLPATEQKMLTLMRDVKVNTELYTFLLNKTQELKVVEAGTVGNVRILDFAMLPYQPIKPKKSLILVLGLVIGMFLGIVLAFIRKAMHQGVEDPDILEQKTGLSVFAGIPHSNLQESLHEKMKKAKGGEKALLALVDDADLSIESLRSLRTNLHFAMMESSNNRVMLTGPAPGLGKSFVSANFGAVLASSGQKVLLMDGDMRKGHLHEYFNLPRSPGLSGLILGQVALDDAYHATEVENLWVMPTGVMPPNPADLLMSEKFDMILDQLSEKFDLILIDTPPVLAVTDAVLIGRRVGVSFMLVRSGHHPLREIQHAIKQVEQAGVSLSGLIFNDIMPKRSIYSYGNYKYHYQYSYKKSA